MNVSREALQVLDRSLTAGNRLKLPEQLDKRLYATVAKVVEAAGGKWSRGAQCHLFDGDAAEAIDPILLTGTVTNAKQEFGFFETPPEIIARMIQIAGVKPSDIVLEPSAGRGAIAIAVSPLCARLHLVEIQSKLAQELSKLGGVDSVWCDDFLKMLANPRFDVVLMNPPFAGQADIHHVTHATKMLKPGGRLVAVMGNGVTFRNNKLTTVFRELVDDMHGTIEELPAGSFKASGTGVNTVLVTLRAPNQ